MPQSTYTSIVIFIKVGNKGIMTCASTLLGLWNFAASAIVPIVCNVFQSVKNISINKKYVYCTKLLDYWYEILVEQMPAIVY